MKKPLHTRHLSLWVVGVLFTATFVLASLLMAEGVPKFEHKNLPAPVAGPVPEKVLLERETVIRPFYLVTSRVRVPFAPPQKAGH